MLKTTKIKTNFTKELFLNIFKKNQKELNKDFNNVFSDEKINYFIENYILEKILTTLISENNIYENNMYDFILSKEIIEYMNKSNKTFIKKKKFEELKKEYENLIVEVEYEDYETYERNIKEEFKLKNNYELFEIDTLPSFLEFSSDLENFFKLPDDSYKSKVLYELYEEYEKLQNKELSNNKISIDYQYGGNCLIDIQLSNTDLIGFYYGGYGDCGALYVSFNQGIYSTVDMH